MSEAAYSVVWTPEAVAGLNNLDASLQLDVLNNVMTLGRNPYPTGLSTVREIDDETFHLRVGAASVLYRVLGLTVVIDLVAVPGKV